MAALLNAYFSYLIAAAAFSTFCSKLESGVSDFEKQDHILIDDVESAMFMVHELAQQKDIDLGYSVDAALPYSIVSDSNRFVQVLLNLLSNGKQYFCHCTNCFRLEAALAAANRWCCAFVCMCVCV